MIQEGGNLVAQGMIRSRFGITSLPGETGGELQGAAGIGKAQLVEVVLIQELEPTFGDVEDGLSENELAFAEGPGAVGGIQKDVALDGGFGLNELIGGPGGVGLNAAAPVEISSPAFDGAQARADLTPDGRIAAAGAERQINTERFKGPLRLAPGQRAAEVRNAR